MTIIKDKDKWEGYAEYLSITNNPNFDNCHIHLEDFSNIEFETEGSGNDLKYMFKKSTMPLMNECDDGNVSYKTFKPYNYSSITGKTTGHCCYIDTTVNDRPCSTIDPSLSKVKSGNWNHTEIDITSDISFVYDSSYTICGLNNDNNAINQISSQVMSLDTPNITTYIVLIIAIFISVLLYAIFVVGPFLFWIKYASNPSFSYEKGCHAGKSILERHYCRDENELPYNVTLIDCYEKPSRQPLPSLDKCPPDHTMYSENPLGNVGGTIWDKIVYYMGGFPYSGINKDRESLYKQYNGNLFIVSVLCLVIIFCISFADKQLREGTRRRMRSCINCRTPKFVRSNKQLWARSSVSGVR